MRSNNRREYPKGFNISIMKSILTRMEKEEFIAYALFFGQLANDSEHTSKQYHFYRQLFTWCKRYYQNNFM
jgi:hypothetical protein